MAGERDDRLGRYRHCRCGLSRLQVGVEAMTTPTPDEICERLRNGGHCREAADLIQQQQATIERLSAALAFYADERNWRSVTVYMCGHGTINCNVMADKGSKARTALGKDARE